jgi:hypothetical protein
MLAAIGLLNLHDLTLTLIESQRRTFVELNPLAASVLHLPAGALVAYKAGLVLAGTGILLALRRHRATEIGCWFLLVVFLLLLVRWHVYVTYIAATAHDPAVLVPHISDGLTY